MNLTPPAANTLAQTSHEDLIVLENQLEQLEEQLLKLEESVEKVDPEKEKYLKEICKEHLEFYAHSRMELDPDNAIENHRLRGKYEGVQEVLRHAEEKQESFNLLLARRKELHLQLYEAKQQIN